MNAYKNIKFNFNGDEIYYISFKIKGTDNKLKVVLKCLKRENNEKVFPKTIEKIFYNIDKIETKENITTFYLI